MVLYKLDYYAAIPIGWSIMHWWPLSVYLSVCPSVLCLTLSQEQKGVGSWLLAWRKPVTRVACDPVYSLKGQTLAGGDFGAAHLLCFIGMLMSNRWLVIMTSKMKALHGCSSHHLQGPGAYSVGPLQATQLIIIIIIITVLKILLKM